MESVLRPEGSLWWERFVKKVGLELGVKERGRAASGIQQPATVVSAEHFSGPGRALGRLCVCMSPDSNFSTEILLT